MGDVKEQAAVLALVSVTDGPWHRTASMIEEVGSALHLLRRKWTGLESFDTAEAEQFAAGVDDALLEKQARTIEALAEDGVQTVTVLDADYPANLRDIFNRPPFLFIKGRLLEQDDRAVAVVGTRAPSDEGVKQARVLAAELARRGVTVLSGLARGIDTAAHHAALAVRGRTVAVMGTGIRRIYPSENVGLAARILGDGGALVSQFWPDAPPRPSAFPMRNVVMSGMAIGTAVVEAGPTSGAKMQARLALEHGKRLFLVESLVMQQEWARRYAERPGTVVVRSVDEILDIVDTLTRPAHQLTLAN